LGFENIILNGILKQIFFINNQNYLRFSSIGTILQVYPDSIVKFKNTISITQINYYISYP